jgi:thiamine biosynthesis protein ThiS
VHVTVNGEPRALTTGLTIAALISVLELNQRRIAVEVNREIIVREQYGDRILIDGDDVEIVHFVGGG